MRRQLRDSPPASAPVQGEEDGQELAVLVVGPDGTAQPAECQRQRAAGVGNAAAAPAAEASPRDADQQQQRDGEAAAPSPPAAGVRARVCERVRACGWVHGWVDA